MATLLPQGDDKPASRVSAVGCTDEYCPLYYYTRGIILLALKSLRANYNRRLIFILLLFFLVKRTCYLFAK